MSDRLIDLAIRLFNAALGAFVAFALCMRLCRRSSRGIICGNDDNLLVVVIVVAIAGFVWGYKLWRFSDPWGARPRK